MNKLVNWLENSFSPSMRKINNNVWVTTLKDSIFQVLPFILNCTPKVGHQTNRKGAVFKWITIEKNRERKPCWQSRQA